MDDYLEDLFQEERDYYNWTGAWEQDHPIEEDDNCFDDEDI